MQVAEEKLRELGVEHAPIQGFAKGDDVDYRGVVISTPPGAYYVLGIDNRSPIAYTNRIQLLFVDCPENSNEIAAALGWRLVHRSVLPNAGTPPAEFAHVVVVSASLDFVPVCEFDTAVVAA